MVCFSELVLAGLMGHELSATGKVPDWFIRASAARTASLFP